MKESSENFHTFEAKAKRLYLLKSFFLLSVFLLGACQQALNNPHEATDGKQVYYASFSGPPKTLDPARSYSSDESIFIAQIYEPPLQYHFLKRPYTLIPLTAMSVPKPVYLDKYNKPLPENAKDEQIALSVYDIQIKPGIYYQPHPAFAKDKKGKYRYLHLSQDEINKYNSLTDFKYQGTRELIAEDYVYQIKRLAHPELQSPILGVMQEYIVGLTDYTKEIHTAYHQLRNKYGEDVYLDLRKYPLAGAQVIDRYIYRITLKGKYPQFLYWLAMSFFSPIPWEADKFYSQADMQDKNITFDWHPVGTGPYMLTANNPNQRMVLQRNPNFHGETYPSEGEPEDFQKGLLEDAGKPIPFIDEFNFSLEKESIPRWTKFLQGYYDQSGVSADNFDQAIQVNENGEPQLSSKMQKQKLHLQTSISAGIFYLGFNMLDDVVGGYSEQARKLREAISIAINYEEFIAIFLNGRGIPAQSPIPPGIFGYQAGEAGINPYVYDWKQGKPKRKSIEYAKQLLAQAGYPNGRNEKTGQPLILNFDVPITSSPDDKARFDWYRKQLAKLGIQLNIRATQYNRFQEKMRTGNAQLFTWGWLADYPDSEDFLFLLYGPNGKVKHGGENATNYSNAEYDRLFVKMKYMPDTPERQEIINKMIMILQRDAPWVWGFYPKDFLLSHDWVRVTKPNSIANNSLKYLRLAPKEREQKRQKWNDPIFWPIGGILLVVLISFVPAFFYYRKKEYSPRKRFKNRNKT